MAHQINTNRILIVILAVSIILYSCSNKLNEEEYIRHNYFYYYNPIEDSYLSKLNDTYSLLLYNHLNVYNCLFYFEKMNEEYLLTKFNFQDCNIYYRKIGSNTFTKIANSLKWIDNNKYASGCSGTSHDDRETFVGKLNYEFAIIQYSNGKYVFTKFCNESSDHKNGLVHDESTNYPLTIIAESELNPELYTKVVRFEEFFSKEIIEKSKIIED